MSVWTWVKDLDGEIGERLGVKENGYFTMLRVKWTKCSDSPSVFPYTLTRNNPVF